MNPYMEDLIKLRQAYREHGYSITNEQADDIWSGYSEEMFAGWLMMGDDSTVLFRITKEHAKALKVI